MLLTTDSKNEFEYLSEESKVLFFFRKILDFPNNDARQAKMT